MRRAGVRSPVLGSYNRAHNPGKGRVVAALSIRGSAGRTSLRHIAAAENTMLFLLEIFHLLLSAVAGLLGSALLLRAYLGWLRLSRTNPVAVFCVALTDWLVAPIRRALPLRGRFDAASLTAALAVALIFKFLTGLVQSDRGLWHWYLLVPSVLLVLVHWVLYLVTLLVFANVVLSLVNPHAPLAPTFDMLTRPVLAPLRRIIPPIGGFDLSPVVLIVAVQILLLVLDQFSF